MFNPMLGRWMEEDPIGFEAGDTNLYRYVGNNPTDATDPSGLIGIIFDGSGYQASDGTIISRFIVPYEKGESEKDAKRDVWYIRTDLGNLWKKVQGAEDLIDGALKRNPNEPIDIMGWSRGAMAALALAKRLEMRVDAKGNPAPVKVRFLGLLDPTAPAKKYTEDKPFRDLDLRKVGDNVQHAALIVRDGKNDGIWATHQVYRTFFSVCSVTFSPKTKVIVNKAVPLDHLHTGFDKQVGEDLWDAARKAGINLPPVQDSPFRETDYNPKPRGGRGFFGNAEKLIRELKLLDD
jgi:hypothetical protein